MGKLTYLRSRYYVPYEYSYFVKRKNKNIYRYLLFKLIANLLEEMFFSVRAYKLANRKIKYISRNNLKILTILRLFIYKFFNFIYSAYFIFRHKIYNIYKKPSAFKRRITKLPHKILNITNKVINNNNILSKLNVGYNKTSSFYVLFIRLLLLLLIRRNVISFNFIYFKNIKYHLKKISNYIFFERYNNILSNVNEDILSFDLRKLILTSIFKIRRYAKRHQFLNKRPILDKISFLVIFNTKRFDKLKRPKQDQNFYSCKLQFRQIYKNIYNLNTTKKFYKYIKYVNSKLKNNLSITKFYFTQIINIINNFFASKNNIITQLNIPVKINNIMYNSNSYYFFSIGDKIEIIYNYYQYILNIRKLHIAYLISLIFFNCCLNLTKDINYTLNDHINHSSKIKKNIYRINISKYIYYQQLENYIRFFQDISNATPNIDSRQAVDNLNIKDNVLNALSLNISDNFKNNVFNIILNTIGSKSIKKFNNSYSQKISLYKQCFKNSMKVLFQYYLKYMSNHSRKKILKFKLINKFKKLYRRNIYNKLYIFLYYKLIRVLHTIKYDITNKKAKVINYNNILNYIYKQYNLIYYYKYFKLKNKYMNKFYNDNYYYCIVNNNENLIYTQSKSNFLKSIHIITPLINIYNHYSKISFPEKILNKCFNVNLLETYINLYYTYILSLYYYDNNIHTNFQINFSVIRQLGLDVYKNYIISMFFKSYNFIYSSYFKPNVHVESKIKTFLLHTIKLNKPYLLNIKNLLFNSTFRYNLNKNYNSKYHRYLIKISEISNLNNLFNKYNLLNKLFNWLCDYIIINILAIIKRNVYTISTYKKVQFSSQLYNYKLNVLNIFNNKLYKKHSKKILFETILKNLILFKLTNRQLKKRFFFFTQKKFKNKNLKIHEINIQNYINSNDFNIHFQNEIAFNSSSNLKLGRLNVNKTKLYTLKKFKNFTSILNKINIFTMHEMLKKNYNKNGPKIHTLDMMRVLNHKYILDNNRKRMYINNILKFKPKLRLFIHNFSIFKNIHNKTNIANINMSPKRSYHNKTNFYMKKNLYFKKKEQQKIKTDKDKTFNLIIQKMGEIALKDKSHIDPFKKYKRKRTKGIQFKQKNIIIQKLYFEYLNNISYYLNIRIATKLYTTYRLLIEKLYFNRILVDTKRHLLNNEKIKIIKNDIVTYYSNNLRKSINNITVSKNIHKLKKKYKISKLKKIINKRSLPNTINTTIQHIIPLYTYLKYIKNSITLYNWIFMYTKLNIDSNLKSTFTLNNIMNIKTYLHNRSQYFESISSIYDIDINKYFIENNKLILYFNFGFNTKETNSFVQINLNNISTDLRYLFNEKNYISLLPRYR